jgi:hypothetical protein
MARCPLCAERSAKRFCPAKGESICAVCCGTHREIDIDCPSSCVYLKTGTSYQSERKPIDGSLYARVQSFGVEFVEQYGPVLATIGQAVTEERASSTWLVDSDVAEVYKALSTTMKTLSSGIYYETLPEGPIRLALFRRLKGLVEALMEPANAETRRLRVSEIQNILDFLLLTVAMNSSGRPRSRQYLDWIAAASGAQASPADSPRLIIP